MDFHHISVLKEETINHLNIRPDGVYVDGTLGGGGHAYEVARRLTSGTLVGIDRDDAAIAAAGQRLSEFSDRVKLVRDNFKNAKSVLLDLGIDGIDGAMLDLGVSSHQLDEGERGFSYRMEAPLDMRMDRRQALSAHTVVNTYSEGDLSRIIADYGEERFARAIARRIVQARSEREIATTTELADLILSAFPAAARRNAGGHPAKRTFQAIRIEVNGELEILKDAVYDLFSCLKPGGRLAIITFHSLEDRAVKQVFTDLSTGCTCSKKLPVCVCGRVAQGTLITRKPFVATAEEQEQNHRAHSAKLRVIMKN